jgi:hypothetical protein
MDIPQGANYETNPMCARSTYTVQGGARLVGTSKSSRGGARGGIATVWNKSAAPRD